MERREIFALSGLAGLALVYLLTVEPVPTVRVRWRNDVSDARQVELERVYSLLDRGGASPDAPRSLSYSLLDTRHENIRALANDSAVADTHYIDRSRYRVDADAPQGARRTWLAHDLPGLRHTAVRRIVIATLLAVAAFGLRRRIAATAALAATVIATVGAAVLGLARRLAAYASVLLTVGRRITRWLRTVTAADDWFDVSLARFSPVGSNAPRFGWVAKLIAASAIVVAIGVPILDTWKALLLIVCFLGLVFGVSRPQVWRVAAAVLIALATHGIKETLPRADIAEGHNAFMVAGDGEALQRGLPPRVFQSWKAQFDALYPADPVRDALPFQWRATLSQTVPTALFAESADAIWRPATYTRQVDAIGFQALGEFRGGFVNESELHSAAHTIRYNFWAGTLERKAMPFFAMYELTPASVGSRLVWKGQAFWYRANGDVEEIFHQQPEARTIALKDAGARVYAAFFPARDRELYFAMEPSLTLRVAGWGDILLTLVGAFGVLLVTTRLRWHVYARAVFIFSVGYFLLLRQIDVHVDHLGPGYSPHSGGDDGLVHDGWGRMMAMLLGQGQIGEALRGAESVYWFTPGMRYVRMLEKLVFGDTDHLHALAVALVPLVFFYLMRCFLRPVAAWIATAIFCLVSLGSLSFHEYIVLAKAGYGESIAGGLFLLGLVLMIRTQPRWGGSERNLAIVWAAGAALAASMFLRPNFALAVIWLGAAYAWSSVRTRDMAAAASFSCGLGLALWMPFHNWYYGHELFFISRSGASVAMPLGASEYVSAFRDALAGRFDTHAVAVTSTQLKGWLWMDGSHPQPGVVHGVRLVALASACAVALRAALVQPSRAYAALGVIAGAALLLHVPMLFVHATLDRYAMLGWDLSLVVLICAYPVEAAVFANRRERLVCDHLDRSIVGNPSA